MGTANNRRDSCRQIFSGGERKLFHVGHAANVIGFHFGGIKGFFVKADGVIDTLQNLLQSFNLQGFDDFAGHGFKFFVVDHGAASSWINGYRNRVKA
jgi:hypothetical protein